MTFDSQCIFCRIVRGEAEAHVVYREDRVTAFLDIHPVTRGHLLVVPHTHAPDLASLEPRDAAAMMVAGRHLAGAVRRTPRRGGGGVHPRGGGRAPAGLVVFPPSLPAPPPPGGGGLGFRPPPPHVAG